MPEQLLALTTALLEAVDALPADARGAFVIASDAVDRGVVLVEHNRVAWATTVGLEHRLRELLVQHAGRGLSRRGLLATPGIEGALRQHSVESLAALVGLDDAKFRWVPRERSLGAPTAFAPTDLLAAVGARLYAREAETARGKLESCAVTGGSFAVGDEGDLIVVEQLAGERLGVVALRDLGAWAEAATEACHGFTPAMIACSLGYACGCAALGWRTARRVVHAVVLDDREKLELAIHDLSARRIPLVISVRVPWKLRDAVVRDAPGAVGNA